MEPRGGGRDRHERQRTEQRKRADWDEIRRSECGPINLVVVFVVVAV